MGVYGSPESREKYAHLIAEWLEKNDEPQCRSTLTIEQLALAYLEHAKGYYVKHNEETDHVYKVRAGLRLLIQLHRCESASDFAPRKFKCLQQVLVDRRRSRTYINDLVGVIKRCFKWGASEELVPVRVFEGLRTVDGLRRGRSAARETEAVQPVSRVDVDAVLPYVSKPIAAMIELQLLTGKSGRHRAVGDGLIRMRGMRRRGGASRWESSDAERIRTASRLSQTARISLQPTPVTRPDRKLECESANPKGPNQAAVGAIT
jgi:hypothetical protein